MGCDVRVFGTIPISSLFYTHLSFTEILSLLPRLFITKTPHVRTSSMNLNVIKPFYICAGNLCKNIKTGVVDKERRNVLLTDVNEG